MPCSQPFDDRRFSPINDTLLANKFYDMYISGFANMSAQFNGTPIFLCNPNFFASPPEWQMRVEGVVTNITTDMIRLDIEPNTGKSTLPQHRLESQSVVTNRSCSSYWTVERGPNQFVYSQ
jgi:hypothetical protein